jgi:alkanesulfonate monooxygenase SsuD/methylene tetrahydromethanopterin reductase-like flavin-dependent oxidoreductase (luciferase family)
MTDQPRQYGLLLPHFGSNATRARIVEASVEAERYGFDSVWVRDHLVFHPHEYEDQDRTFIDPIVALSAIAAVTKKIILATGSLIPHRHPIHTALLLGSLDFIAGPNRIIAGFGLGTYNHEFDAMGLGEWDRRELLPEQVEIFRKLWTGESVEFEGKFYKFDNVDVHPTPKGKMPIWYCGTSAAAVRRAVEYCDGWIPGRMPRHVFSKRMDRMRWVAEQNNRPDLPDAGCIPWVSPGRTKEEAAKKIDVPLVLSATEAKYGEPPGGRTGTLDDLDGGVMAGPPDYIIEEVRKYQEVGALHMVFDLRARFEDWEECLAILGEEVLPELKRGDASATGARSQPAAATA